MELNTCIKNIENFFPDGSLRQFCFEGAKRIYGSPLPEEVVDRLEFELEIIKKADAEQHLLLVQDIVNTAKKELGALVGPGRGAIAGSLAAFCLGITEVDPLKPGLMFERFINPDRLVLYDIDIDIDDDGKAAVIHWFEQKYGTKAKESNAENRRINLLNSYRLSEIKTILALIKQAKGVDVDLRTIPLDDPETFKLIQYGNTDGVFCFDTTGMQHFQEKMQPTSFDDLVILNTMYRPGTLDQLPLLIDRKKGLQPIRYDIPCMEKYLHETYGILVYQEQLMMLARLIANFSRGESDRLRKALGKRKQVELSELKPQFMEGGISNGYDKKTLRKVWGHWYKEGLYAFCKAHAVCYTLIAYQMAYLKTHYKKEFEAVIKNENGSTIYAITVD